MNAPETPSSATAGSEPRLKIYLLPNLLTAGNLFCGFVALTKIVEANPAEPTYSSAIKYALFFILLACIFDIMDGRVARWGGSESAFGREFDSLADLISFGVAPAFLVHRIVLKDVFVNHPEVGWFIASIYLMSGALRLARFNCIAAESGSGGSKEFLGFPIPAAAGLVASLTLFLIWYDDRNFPWQRWRYTLPVIMLFLSIMMISDVKYPSFKSIHLNVQRPFGKLVVATTFVGLILVLRERILPVVLPIIFTAYLIYGFIRPKVSRKFREEIEDIDPESGD